MEWTPHVQRRVISLRGAGLSWADIAERFNALELTRDDMTATALSMRVRAYQLGLVPRNRYTVWSPEMDDVLRRVMETGGTLREVAERLGVSRNAAIGRWYRLRRPRMR